MLLLNGKPVAGNFLEKQAQRQGKTLNDITLKKTTTFKLSDSYFRKTRLKEMRSGKFEEKIFCPPSFNLEPTYLWQNPETGMTEKLTYTTNYLPGVDGVNMGEVFPVEIEYGFITVDPTQNDLYYWLNNHPDNQTNPEYVSGKLKPKKPFRFYEVMPDVEAIKFVDHERIVSKAILMFTDKDTKGWVNDEALMHLAKSYGYGNTANAGRKDLEKFMLKHVKQNPQKVLNDISSAATEVRSVIADAVTFGIIKFDLPYVKWVDLSKGKRTANKGIICQISNGLDSMDFFVEWLREKDNSGVFNQMKKELDDKKLEALESATVSVE